MVYWKGSEFDGIDTPEVSFFVYVHHLSYKVTLTR